MKIIAQTLGSSLIVYLEFESLTKSKHLQVTSRPILFHLKPIRTTTIGHWLLLLTFKYMTLMWLNQINFTWLNKISNTIYGPFVCLLSDDFRILFLLLFSPDEELAFCVKESSSNLFNSVKIRFACLKSHFYSYYLVVKFIDLNAHKGATHS